MTKHNLFIFLCASLAIGCSEPNGTGTRDDGDDGDSTGDATSTTAPTTTASTTTTVTTTTTAPDGESSSDDGDTTGAQDESSSGEVACTGQCVAPPAGWNGPVVMGRSSDGDASCDDDAYAAPMLTGNVGLNVPPFACGCSCSVTEEGACDPFSSLHVHDDPQCDDPPQTIAVSQGCTNISDQGEGYFQWSIGASGGACEPVPQVNPTPLSYDESVVACTTEAVVEGSCEDDAACVVAPTSGAPMCWWQEGDVECPADLAGPREVIYTGTPIDSRSCTSCECGEPEVTCEAPGVAVVQANSTCDLSDLSPAPVGLAPGACLELSAARSVVWQVFGEPDTSCAAAAPSTPTGTAEAQGAVTVCCPG